MDWTNVWIAGATVLSTLLGIIGYIGKKFDVINGKFDCLSKDLRQLDSRLSRIEGYIERDMIETSRIKKSTGSENL